MRPILTLTVAVAAAIALAACGTEKITVAQSDPAYQGAELFSQRCGGCHTLTPAGTQGSDSRSIRSQGPNLDQRNESTSDVLFAIRNGGYSGAIMPQNIVTGKDADKVAKFVASYAGTQEVSSVRPGETSSTP